MKKTALIVLMITLLIALAACVTPDDNDKECVISFYTGKGKFVDGTTAEKVKPDSNGKIVMNKEPRADGYAFVEWRDESGKKFDPSAKYTKSKSFTAQYLSGAENSVYDALFDENSKIDVDINMSDAEWKKLNQDYKDFRDKGGKSPIYRLADSVTISIESADGQVMTFYYEEVGVRMKGNTSRHEFYGDDGFFDNVHLKLSFKQTFDDVEDGYKESELKVWTDDEARSARKARTLGGMEKIDLKYNSTADETYVRELYAMKMFRDNGIFAPNVTLCSLTALEKNETAKNMGVYRIHEPVDEAFISRRLKEDKVGDLYKCTYTKPGPADLTNYDLDKRVGVEDELKGEFYSYDKKTNKKKNKNTGLRDFSSIKNFITAINTSGADYEKLLDVDYFVKFEAINYILGNPDCIRNNYNNYYLYFRADGKAIIIPYDYDRCLGITKDWDPTHERNPAHSANMQVTPYTRTVAATGEGQRNPLYINLIDKGAPTAVGSALMRYRQNLIEVSASQALTVTAFEAYKNNFKSKYSSYTSGAISSNSVEFDGNTGNVPYATYITTKLKTLNDNIDNYRP